MERKSLNKLVVQQSQELFADRAKSNLKHQLLNSPQGGATDTGGGVVGSAWTTGGDHPFNGATLENAGPAVRK